MSAVLAELLLQPILQMLLQRMDFHLFTLNIELPKVPCHIEEQRQLIGGYLRIVNIGNPHAARTVFVSSTHFVVE